MIDGFLVIDKPEGLTSHDVVQRVRRIANQRRVGHLGTLDPLATGVLPIALGEATKLSQLLTHGAKSYRGKVQLGVETTTYDREGEVVARTDGPWPTRAELEKALSAFAGEIEQVPPPYSAVKQGGQAAYRRARRGEEVKLEPRRVSISRVELTSYEPPLVSLEVDCSAGTYLRSMAHDLGAALGTGAHLHELCRTRSGPFQLSQSITPGRAGGAGRARRGPGHPHARRHGAADLRDRRARRAARAQRRPARPPGDQGRPIRRRAPARPRGASRGSGRGGKGHS